MCMIVVWQSILSVAWCFHAFTNQGSSIRQWFTGPNFANNRFSIWVVLLHYDGQGVPVVALMHVFTCPHSWVAYGLAVIIPNGISPAGPSLQGCSQSGTRHSHVGKLDGLMSP